MALIVQKYGGTSVADLERIKQVACRVIKVKEAGNDIIVVVSAMAGETDRLISLFHKISKNPPEREYDLLISTGEQVSTALLTMAIQEMGYDAISFLAYQIRIVTDKTFTKARILKIDSGRIKKALSQGKIVVVAGFQGVSKDDSITTLGRGGSDVTAVALSAALGAQICEIYTDVEGVFTTDPQICPQARRLKKISYEEMLEMASLGAKVLQTRSVEFAKKYGVPILVRSSFSQGKGTLVTREDKEMEKVLVSGIAYSKDEAKITITRVPDRPGIASKIFTPISEAGIVVDMIIQNVSADGFTDLTFTVPKTDLSKAMKLVEAISPEIGASSIQADENIAKVSIIGVGMRSHAGVASKMFSTLASEGINIMMISTSEIKISCVIEAKYTELAVRVLHDTFELGKET